MKSTAVGTACPEEVALTVAGIFAATLNRIYAAPPPLSVMFTGVVSRARVSSGKLPEFNAGRTLRKFQLGFVFIAGTPRPASSVNCATAQSRDIVIMFPKTALKLA
jgi:hypothetical protein